MYILPLASLDGTKVGFTKPDLSSSGLRISRPFSISPSKKKGPLMLQTQTISVLNATPTTVELDIPQADMDNLMAITSSFFAEHTASMFDSRKFTSEVIRSRISLHGSNTLDLSDSVTVLDQFDNPTTLTTGDSVTCVLLFDSVIFAKASLTPKFKLLFARKESTYELPDFKSLVPSMEIINHDDIEPTEVPLPDSTPSEMDFFS